jgi:hypothetical protein
MRAWAWERGIIDRNSGHDDEVFEEFYGLGGCVASFECRPWKRGHQRCGAAFVSCFFFLFLFLLLCIFFLSPMIPGRSRFPFLIRGRLSQARRWLLLLPSSRIQKPRTNIINVSLPMPCLAMPCRCEQNAVIAHISYSLSCQKLQSGSSSSGSSKSSPRTVLYNPTVCHARRTQMRYQTPSNAAKRPSRVPTFHSSLPFHASPVP